MQKSRQRVSIRRTANRDTTCLLLTCRPTPVKEITKNTLAALSDGWKDINDAYAKKSKPKDNPRNVDNQDKLQSFQRFGTQLEKELLAWNEIQSHLSDYQSQTEATILSHGFPSSPSEKPSEFYSSILSDAQKAFLGARPNYPEQMQMLTRSRVALTLMVSVRKDLYSLLVVNTCLI